jgi:hypothetical protein
MKHHQNGERSDAAGGQVVGQTPEEVGEVGVVVLELDRALGELLAEALVVLLVEGLLDVSLQLASLLLARARVQVESFGELLEHLTQFHRPHGTRGVILYRYGTFWNAVTENRRRRGKPWTGIW